MHQKPIAVENRNGQKYPGNKILQILVANKYKKVQLRFLVLKLKLSWMNCKKSWAKSMWWLDEKK